MIIGVVGKARHGKDTVAAYLKKNYRFVRVGLADPMKRICKEVFKFSDEQLYGNERDEPDLRYLHRRKGSNGSQDVRAFLTTRETQSPQVDFCGTVFAGMENLVEFGTYDGQTLANLPSPPTDQFLTPRYALQTLGTEWGRNCYQDVWIDYGIWVAKALENGYTRYSVQEGLVETAKDVGEIGGVVFSDLRFKNEVDAVKKAGGIVWRVVRPGCQLEVNGVAGHVSEKEQDGIPDSDLDCVLRNDEEGNLSFLYHQVDEAMKALRKGTA